MACLSLCVPLLPRQLSVEVLDTTLTHDRSITQGCYYGNTPIKEKAYGTDI